MPCINESVIVLEIGIEAGVVPVNGLWSYPGPSQAAGNPTGISRSDVFPLAVVSTYRLFLSMKLLRANYNRTSEHTLAMLGPTVEVYSQVRHTAFEFENLSL
jgi:hypothetical protein